VNKQMLAIDIGNSITSLGIFESAKLLDQWRMTSQNACTADEIWIALTQYFHASGQSLPSIGAISISSVVPMMTSAYARMAERRLGIKPAVITAETQKMLRVEYDPPSSVGPDRICGGAAAFREYGGPVLVIDLGTATVFDFVSEEGVYRGGLIAPGIATAAESLHYAAAMLPQVDYAFPPTLIGKTTETAIQSGILNGAVAMIDGIVEKIQAQEKKSLRVVATGGFAAMLSERSKAIQYVEPDLVLRGIQILTAAM